MSDPIDPLRAVRGPQRRSGRERRAPTGDDGLPANLPAVAESEPEPAAAPREPKAASDGALAFAAQLLGQPGQKRGLRAGAPALDAARSAYKKTEYSGPADRRPPAGRAAKTEI
ncbi:MAG: hypothetical protein IT546_13830 [Caulobacteraceae bacterium]|nr:hypothetical protein [Caulobacteraceae bacterium]